MSSRRHTIAFALAVCVTVGVLAAPSWAAIVKVTINGTVEYNQVDDGLFGSVNAGDDATMTFLLDSDDFVDSGSFPTRGYAIDADSYDLTLGSVSVGLADPYPAGQTPYFVLRNDDPAVDGFFLSNGTDFPGSLALDEPGGFGDFGSRFSVTYGDDPLSSLDLLDAIGEYDFSGLSVFGFAVTDGPFDPIGIVFENMVITVVPGPGAAWLLVPALSCGRRRRHG